MRFDVNSNDNAVFSTSQCNNHCLMCCQPPTREDDIDGLLEENLELIRTAPKDLKVLAITGGEPTLLGDKLVYLVSEIRKNLPETAIQILSNGRNFKDYDFAKRVVEASEGNIFVGIPLHSDYSPDHDKIACAKNAFSETIFGLYNLANLGVEIELRVVINKLNYTRLANIGDFAYKNLPFVSWIAFMGMEKIGLSIRNLDKVWVEPKEYSSQLSETVVGLNDLNYTACIYNIPLCLLPNECWSFAKKSISNWKTKYLDVCESCSVKSQCCGHFSTSSEPFEGITAL